MKSKHLTVLQDLEGFAGAGLYDSVTVQSCRWADIFRILVDTGMGFIGSAVEELRPNFLHGTRNHRECLQPGVKVAAARQSSDDHSTLFIAGESLTIKEVFTVLLSGPQSPA